MSETTATTAEAPAETTPEETTLAAPAEENPTPAADAPAVSPLEGLRQRLAESPTPLVLKDATKGLAPKSKKAPPPDFPALLAEEVQAGRAFWYPSGPKGLERYWAKDEKQVIREAVLGAAGQPRKLGELQKVAKEATQADKPFAAAIVDELLSTGQLHKQSSGTNALIGVEKSRALDRDAVTAAVLAAAEPPQNVANLIKAASKDTGADKAFIEPIIAELIQDKRLHPQSKATKPTYGKHAIHALDVEPGKKAFAALVKAGQKLLEAVPDVPMSEVLQRLRTELERPQTAPPAEPQANAGPREVSPVSHQPPTQPSSHANSHAHAAESSAHDLSLGDTLPSGAYE
jgi:hypothetical protein